MSRWVPRVIWCLCGWPLNMGVVLVALGPNDERHQTLNQLHAMPQTPTGKKRGLGLSKDWDQTFISCSVPIITHPPTRTHQLRWQARSWAE